MSKQPDVSMQTSSSSKELKTPKLNSSKSSTQDIDDVQLDSNNQSDISNKNNNSVTEQQMVRSDENAPTQSITGQKDHMLLQMPSLSTYSINWCKTKQPQVLRVKLNFQKINQVILQDIIYVISNKLVEQTDNFQIIEENGFYLQCIGYDIEDRLMIASRLLQNYLLEAYQVGDQQIEKLILQLNTI